MIPFKKLPIRVIIEMVISISLWLDIFPPTYGISTTIILKTTVTGLHMNDKKSIFIFLSYIQTHEEHNNGMGL